MTRTRFDRLKAVTLNYPGAKKATPEMIELQALSLVSLFVNFWRFTIQENRYNEIYPSTLALVEAPTGTGKNASFRFMRHHIFGFAFKYMFDLVKSEELAWVEEEIEKLEKEHPGEDNEKKFEKAKRAFLASRRDLDAVLGSGDDSTYEGFGLNRAYLERFKYGSIMVKSEEFLDRLKSMRRNVFLQTFYGKLLELIDYDVLDTKITKAREGATPGSQGMGTTLYFSMPKLEDSARKDVKDYVLSSMGRRGFLLRETNQSIQFRELEELDEEEVDSLENEIHRLAEHLEKKGARQKIEFSIMGAKWYEDYQMEQEIKGNEVYQEPPSLDKDVRCALMQDMDRKVMKVAALLAVFNHGETSVKIKVEDLEAAKDIVERAFENARNFFDMSDYSHTNSLISHLQGCSPRWVSAKEMLDAGLFPSISSRGYQPAIKELMMRDIFIAAENKDMVLEHRAYNNQDQYRIVAMAEADKRLKEFEEKVEEISGGNDDSAEREEISYQFSYLNETSFAANTGYRVAPLDELEERLKKPYHYSAVEFVDGKRIGSNFIKANLLILDVDEDFTIKQAVETFKDYWCMIATTKSHGIEKNGKICDRFRIILKSDIEFTNGEDFKLVMSKILPMVNADTQTVDMARLYVGAEGARVLKNPNGVAPFPASALLKKAKAELEAEKAKKAKYKPVHTDNETPYGTVESMLIDLNGRGERVDALSYARTLPADESFKKPICCPFHEDKSPSAFISHYRDGRVQISCSSGCDTQWIKS